MKNTGSVLVFWNDDSSGRFQLTLFRKQKRSQLFYASAPVGAFFNAPEKEKNMENKYEEMYYILFNAITNAMKILEKAQQKVEEIYMSSDS